MASAQAAPAAAVTLPAQEYEIAELAAAGIFPKLGSTTRAARRGALAMVPRPAR